MKVIDENGEPLDARADLEPRPGGFDVVVASRGGRRGHTATRNPDYDRVIETILERAAQLDAKLSCAMVESLATRNLLVGERLLSMDAHPYPVDLGGITSFRELRIELCRPQASIRGPAATGRGSNRNKKIRIQFELPQDLPGVVLESLLESGRKPTLSENEVAKRFRELDRSEGARPPWDPDRLARLLEACQTATPRGRARASLQIERGPVGNIVKEWNGWRCQLCGAFGLHATGFLTPSGVPYVEAHHVVPVSSGVAGVLNAENIVTVCPNHHRELHYGRAVVIDEGDSFRITVELGTACVPKASGILQALGRAGSRRDRLPPRTVDEVDASATG